MDELGAINNITYETRTINYACIVIHMHIFNYNYFIYILDVDGGPRMLKLGLRGPRVKKGWEPLV